VKSPKHEARDAEALCEAVTRPTRRVVPIKRVAQQDLQALHRVWERLIQARTALVQGSRGLLSASGMVLPHSLATLRALIVAKLTALSPEVCRHLYAECLALATRLAYDDAKLTAMGQAPPACQRLQTMPGVGPVTATARIAAIGEATQFTNGRQFAAWLSLVPREHSTGGMPRSSGSLNAGIVIGVHASSTVREPRPVGSTRGRMTGAGG
jgi:transposase